MSGRRARVLAVAMYVAAAFCCVRLVFRVLSAPFVNPIFMINLFLWDGIIAVLLVLVDDQA